MACAYWIPQRQRGFDNTYRLIRIARIGGHMITAEK